MVIMIRRLTNYTRDGYNITLTDEPIVVGDRFFVNLARTTPFEPCLLVTLPHTTRNLDPALIV